MERLIPRQSEETQLAKFLHARVVGQEAAVASIVAQYDKLMAGMNDPSRPIASLLFLGPTGVGKTKIVEAFCEYLFGEGEKPLKVNCGEYTHDHQIAKLIGSPAGYIGYGEKPVFARERVEDRRTKDGRQLNVVLFDEIEKAGSAEHKGDGANAAGALNNLMLSIFDRGELNLSNGQHVNFTHTIIFMTSNLGATELIAAEKSGDESKLKQIAEESARRFFNPEQFNRLDEMVVFKTLTPEQIMLICDLEVTEVADRAKMELDVDDEVRQILVQKGYDIRYGARQLKRAVDRWITRNLASLMAGNQLRHGNRVRVEVDKKDGSLAFFRMEGTASIEEAKPAKPAPIPVAVAPELKYRNQGYVRNMLDRKYRFGDSTGAKIYAYIKKSGFVALQPEVILDAIKKEGWTTDSENPIAMVKFVLHDWTKKQWAEKLTNGSYIVKE